MGVVNITPDSFSDGGTFLNPEQAILHAHKLAAEGAAIIDFGAESTRPGSSGVDPIEEERRLLPVLQGLPNLAAQISIDTRHAVIMRLGIEHGATIINDVSALRHDPASLPLIAESGVSVVLMHMRGTPETMQQAPLYRDVIAEVYEFLARRVAACEAVGLAQENIAIDPGIGFGKTLAHNIDLLRHIRHLQTLGPAVLVGASRKGFIARLSGNEMAEDRLGGSLAILAQQYNLGVRLFRVHDIAPSAQALCVAAALAGD